MKDIVVYIIYLVFVGFISFILAGVVGNAFGFPNVDWVFVLWIILIIVAHFVYPPSKL